ncbi:heme A synthase [Nereida ignava]|uniref:Heme A synthase n=1 Tax=Nereida ignava TaxID=282199 RepID=A0A0U1NIM7_9RHOB|nr:heme A synthase [Nereida ignava]CRK74389.1 Heme A synthase [Nereida ignava]SFJ47308.1 cytochrome c oxidase assembly protein subunit 15 [Nereida ignava DSM 16309]
MAKSRAIFEEVSSKDKGSNAPVTGGIDAARRGARGFLKGWLIVLFALVVMMIAVGGLTRLTDSGLSITEWRPVTGAIPPMNAADWASEFEKYQEIPEYQLQNKGMSMSEFKVIYWWEWGHRQLGRFVGLVWAIGFFGLLATRQMPVGWTGKAALLGALGGSQGAIGWWMVSSGLDNGMLDVASYRLATHLGLAFVILGVIAWYVLQLSRSDGALIQARRLGEPVLAKLAVVLIALTGLQILMGALVAGIDAGRNYIDWPLMAGGFLPPDLFTLEPLWRNFFEDDGLVQFMHRMTGYILFGFGIFIWLRARRSPNTQTRFAFNLVLAMMTVQMVLGIVTVMNSSPWELAIVHQFGAVVLWVLVLRARFLAIYPLAQSVRG